MISSKTASLPLTIPTRRWLPLAVGLGVLLVMAFYAVSDPLHLASDRALAGADWMSAALCHRITARSFVMNGRQFPLCVRCTGMYLGVMVAVIALALAGRLRWAELPPLRILLVLIGFIGLMGVDGLNSYSHFFPDFPHVYEPRNWLRLLTGIGTGLAMGVIMTPTLAQTVWRSAPPRSVLGSFTELLLLLALAGTAVILVISNQPLILYVMAIVSAAGMWLIVAALNVVFLLVLTRRDGRATTWRETAVYLSIGLILAAAELSLLTMVRWQLLGTIVGFPGIG